MATSTLIQRLSTGDSSAASHRRQVETFVTGADVASNPIVAGDVVMWDVSASAGGDRLLTVIQSELKALGQTKACGVAIDGSSVAGEKVRVVISGYAVANCAADTGTIVAGDPLVASVVTDGEVELLVAADLARPFGVALENADAVTTNFVEICVYPQF